MLNSSFSRVLISALFGLAAIGTVQAKSNDAAAIDTQKVAAAGEGPSSYFAAETEADMEALRKRGRIVWFKCRSCHELAPDGRHKVGPNLNGVIGSPAASKDGFVYSEGMKGAGIVWDDAALDEFITKPSKFVKGTKMAFIGIKKESDRKALIAYLHQETE